MTDSVSVAMTPWMHDTPTWIGHLITLLRHALPWSLLGLAGGAAFFASLRTLSRLLLQPPADEASAMPWFRLGALQALRLLAMTALLVLAARQGALPLLGLAAGIGGARLWLLRRTHRAATDAHAPAAAPAPRPAALHRATGTDGPR